MKKLYLTIYLADTDEIVAAGTIDTCAKILGKSKNGISSMVSKSTKGIQKKYTIYKEYLDSEDIP